MSKDTREKFFSEPNEQMLDRLLYDHVQRRSGATLDDRQKQRLVKTVKHYMGEVYRVNTTQNIQFLNKETLAAVLPDYTAYLDRSREQETSEKTEVEIVTSSDPLRQDVGTRFALMQDSRNVAKAAPPAPPDFRIPLEEDTSSAAQLFEMAKKQREAEAMRTALAVQEQLRPREAGVVAPQRARILENEVPAMTVPPDMRALFGMQSQGRTPYEPQGLAQANPTIAVPTLRAEKPVLPQDFLQKEEDTINYKESEYNLFCYSADRDWTVNTGESRYNFSVLFNPGNVLTNNGVRANTSTQIKFRNIVRIELVKALVPVEGIDVLIDQGATTTASYNQTIVNTNVLSFPYLMVRVPELDTNSVGTNPAIDSAFGLIQYDANWITDNTNVVQRGGFLGMIPKFMKCQKVYYPTPLATLQKMTIQLQRPDGSLVSPVLDTLDISGFILSNSITQNWVQPTVSPIPNTGTIYGQMTTVPGTNSGTPTAAGYSRYIWIQTNSWFNTFMFNQGDRIQLKNLAFTSTFTGNTTATQDFITYLTDSAGLLVANIGYFSRTTSSFITGTNSVGYANYIIVDARYNDPTKGYTTVSPFGGIANDTFAGTLISGSPSAPKSGIISSGRLINLSHQTQVVFRVITRDMDAATRLRPDNLN